MLRFEDTSLQALANGTLMCLRPQCTEKRYLRWTSHKKWVSWKQQLQPSMSRFLWYVLKSSAARATFALLLLHSPVSLTSSNYYCHILERLLFAADKERHCCEAVSGRHPYLGLGCQWRPLTRYHCHRILRAPAAVAAVHLSMPTMYR
jgi:hypothetical protein